MTSYLYVLSIGPVQDFIAAARRTRDLWFGSHLLSEISKAAAREIAKNGGKLIFPALDLNDENLKPSSKPGAYSVANIILAELPEGVKLTPSKLNESVKNTARDEWKKYAEIARDLAKSVERFEKPTVSSYGGSDNLSTDHEPVEDERPSEDNSKSSIIRDELWNEQVDDVIEFYSAWVPLDREYQAVWKSLMRLHASRKSTRNFIPAKGHPMIPKSSLDGARESVLLENKEIPSDLVLKMRLSDGEQLCAVGLTKRLGAVREDSISTEGKLLTKNKEKIRLQAFPSVTRVSLDPWIRRVFESGKEAIQTLEQIYSICKGNPNIASGSGKYYSQFPFDGEVLYPSRLTALTKLKKNKKVGFGWEVRLTNKDLSDLERIKYLAEKLQKGGEDDSGRPRLGLGEPDRYFAVLVADGDHMGKVISTRRDQNEHRKFSKKLAIFAGVARSIIDMHQGCLVYSGGDDVLAFLPLDKCLGAARELHDGFGKLLEKCKDKDGKAPTLSVGVAIGHSIEPLEDLLRFGRDAEQAAKKGKTPDEEKARDGLAVHLHTRSGGEPIRLREKWKPKGDNGLDERLLQWAKMHEEEKLPDGAAYDIHEMARDYQGWNDFSKEELNDLIAKDALRLLKRKKACGGKETLKDDEIKNLLKDVNSFEKICLLADEMILARRLAVAMKQAKGKPQKEGKS
jgi:CRISPR-associated protein Cmr2